MIYVNIIIYIMQRQRLPNELIRKIIQMRTSYLLYITQKKHNNMFQPLLGQFKHQVIFKPLLKEFKQFASMDPDIGDDEDHSQLLLLRIEGMPLLILNYFVSPSPSTHIIQ